MTLAVDTRRALRTRPELVGLVEAIRDAPPGEPETTSVEWKRELDVATRPHRFSSARHILGFGNRDPSTAAPYFEGCAYLVVGAEPGRLTGVPNWDPADLHNWLERYIAPGRPRWHPETVTVSGVDVVIFAIEAPSWGDPIHTLQTTYERYTSGRIFARRGGKTVEASPSEVNQLELRLTRGAEDINLEVVACAHDGELRSALIAETTRETWRTSEERRLRGALARASSIRPGPGPLGRAYMVRDTRSEERYEAEIADYLARIDASMDTDVFENAVNERLGLVELSVSNPTRRNFPETQVELTLPAGARVFTDETDPADQLEPPAIPEPWGAQTVAWQWPGPTPSIPALGQSPVTISCNDEATTVRFRPIGVRPGRDHKLPDLHLFAPAEMTGGTLAVAWRATSTGATGWAEGALELPVSEAPRYYGFESEDGTLSVVS